MKYLSPDCAAWAKDKLNGFEFPSGYRLQVRYAQASSGPLSSRTSQGSLRYLSLTMCSYRGFRIYM